MSNTIYSEDTTIFVNDIHTDLDEIIKYATFIKTMVNQINPNSNVENKISSSLTMSSMLQDITKWTKFLDSDINKFAESVKA